MFILSCWDCRDHDRMVAGFYNYLCNRCMWPTTLKVRIPLRRGVFDPTLCDNVCSDLGQVGGFPRFSLRNSWSIVESGDNTITHNPPLLPCRVFTNILQFLHKKATWFWILLKFPYWFLSSNSVCCAFDLHKTYSTRLLYAYCRRI